jgi:hypothetical protein
MTKYKYTPYFENEVLRNRPYLKKEWCAQVVENPIRVESQEWKRFRFWGRIDELDGGVLRDYDLQCISRKGIEIMKITCYQEKNMFCIGFFVAVQC